MDEAEAGFAWVLTFSHYDLSAFKVVRVYDDPDRAAEDFELVSKNSSDGKWELVKVPFFQV